VLRGGALSEAQRWGVAAAAAVAARHARLREVVLAAALTGAGAEVVEDAKAAASPVPPHGGQAHLRRETSRAPDEPAHAAGDQLMALAVSAINGCGMCVRAHEKTVTDAGLTPDHVNDAVRIAATIYAAAVALEAGAESPALEVSTPGV
jgi:alkyl hydroperoxide reductase subunit D